MKITGVEVISLSVPLKKPNADAININLGKGAILVKIYTDEGITGIGEAQAPYSSPLIIKAAIEKNLRQYLIGENPFNRERIWEKLYRATTRFGRKGAVIAAISAVDIAIWDILGKSLEMPIYRLLGGYRDEVRAYASAGFYMESKTVDDLAKEMAQFPKQGFTAVKMKIGRDPALDLERVRAVREGIGEETALIVDANAAWTVKTAIRFSKEIGKYNILFFEEPVSQEDVEGHAKVTSSIDIPTATGEQEYTRYGFADLIVNRAVDIVQPDAVTAGGISEVYKIAISASAQHMLCSPHNFASPIAFAANLHLIASIPNGFIVEFDTTEENPLRYELISEPFKIDGRGFVKLPTKPGLGVELNEKTISKYREDLSLEGWKDAGKSLKMPVKSIWNAPSRDTDIPGIP